MLCSVKRHEIFANILTRQLQVEARSGDFLERIIIDTSGVGSIAGGPFLEISGG